MKTVAIALREDLNDVDRSWLKQQLVAHPGISDVYFHREHSHQLTVEYDPAALNETALLDCIYRQGLYPEPAPAQ
jgi:hypothetical protein